MKKILIAVLLVVGLASACVPNDPNLVWHGIHPDGRKFDIPQGELVQRPWLWDEVEAWCIVPASQGGEGKIELTTFGNAFSRQDVTCWPDEGQADRQWFSDRDKGW